MKEASAQAENQDAEVQEEVIKDKDDSANCADDGELEREAKEASEPNDIIIRFTRLLRFPLQLDIISTIRTIIFVLDDLLLPFLSTALSCS